MWRDVARLSAGTIVGHASVLLATPLLTRLYPPEAFGQLGLFLAFSSVALVCVGLRYDVAIASAKSEAEANALLTLAMITSMPTALACAGALELMRKAEFLGLDGLPFVATLGAVPFLMAASIFMALRYWNVRGRDFGPIATAVAWQGAGRAAGPLAVYPVLHDWWGLFVGELLGRVLGLRRLLAAARPAIRTTNLACLRRVAISHWRYPVFVLPSALVDTLAVALPLPILASLHGESVAGQFALVQRIAAAPSALLATSFADVFHARAMAAIGGPEGSLRKATLDAAKRMSVVAAVIYVPIAVFGPIFSDAVFGAEWGAAGTMMSILSPALWLVLVVSPISRVILVTGRVKMKLVADTACLVLPVSALWMARGESANVAVAALSGAMFVSYTLYLIVIWLAARAEPATVPRPE